MIVLLSSTSLRVLSYFFLRWLPGALFPKLISGLYVLYIGGLYFQKHKPSRRFQWLGAHGSRQWNTVNISINSLLLVFVLDATFGDWLINDYADLKFARAGHVGEHTAKIAIRLPRTSEARLCYHEENDVGTKICEELDLSAAVAETDFILTHTIEGLTENTGYAYYLLGDELHYPSRPSSLPHGLFKTAPSADSRWSFLASSCIVPNFPYNPARRNRVDGWEMLHEYELSGRALRDVPNFMFFLGDFIYYDLPFYPTFTIASYFKKYRTNYASTSFRRIYGSLPLLHVYDDHDVVNNFDMGEHARPYPIANQAFEAYQGMSNPTPRKPGQTWYTYEYGGVDFFMLDTRRFRSRNRDRDGPEKTMLGEEQLSELLTWLSTASDSHFKIIISSIPFTENWKGVDDTWGGFLTERLRIIETVEATGRDVLVISGDRHEFASTEISTAAGRVLGYPGRIVDISISPLNQFYLPLKTYSSHVNDTELRYLPNGNVKWGRFIVDNTGKIPRLDFELKVYGQTAWTYTMFGSQLHGYPR